MKLTDTHSHLYDEAFDRDREEALARAAAEGVGQLLLPAIDSESHERLFGLCRRHPQRCIPMMGLHPTSVNDNPRWRDELALVESYLRTPPEGIAGFCAVGEIGLDLYWSRDFREEQAEDRPFAAIRTADRRAYARRLARNRRHHARIPRPGRPGRFPRLFRRNRNLSQTEGVRRFRFRNRRRSDL